MRLNRAALLSLTALAILLAVIFLPGAASARAESAAGVVTADFLNVRSGPGPGYSSITTLQNGELVTLLARDSRGAWLKVGLPAGGTGWVSSLYIETSIRISTLPIASNANASGSINTDFANLREQPGTNYAAVAVLPRGTQVTLLGRSADYSWIEVAANGMVGWVAGDLLLTSTNLAALPITGAAPTTTSASSGANNGASAPSGSSTGSPVSPFPTGSGAVAIVNTPRLNVRTGPGSIYPAIATVSGDDVVTLLGRVGNNSWVYVEIFDGTRGWVTTYYLINSVPYSSLPIMQ